MQSPFALALQEATHLLVVTRLSEFTRDFGVSLKPILELSGTRSICYQ